ncbi:unnamed protein product [Cuscuta epithymum]|uniref:DUF8040 domain-containing protein n=1 Tax=Cuscuta epithymum TaxID=186058 RepID=A0AAV0CT39_9ASTE|nr:unnamed protein product [Cuscuta epithymum]
MLRTMFKYVVVMLPKYVISCGLLRSGRNCWNSMKESREPGCMPVSYDQIYFFFFTMGKWKISSSNEEESDNETKESDNHETDILCGIVVSVILFGHSLHGQRRLPYRTSVCSRAMFITEVLQGHIIRCYQDFRLHKEVFISVCEDLKCHYGFVESRELSIEESLGIFLMTLAHGVGNRLVQETFKYSGETIHRHFHLIL